MMRGCARKALLAFILLIAAAAPARAQRVVRFVGHGERELDNRIRALLRGPYTLIFSHDTIIRQGQTVQGNLLIVRSAAGIEGTVQGTLLELDANVFVRPTAHITGDLINLGGGLYRSELSKTDGTVINRPLAPYRVRTIGDTLEIAGLGRAPSRFPFLVEIPTYDRVSGATLPLGFAVRLPVVGPVEPEVRGQLGFRTSEGKLIGGLELALVRPTTLFAFGFYRGTLTNEAWIRSDFPNTLSFLFGGKDYRNYYQGDRVYAEFDHVFNVSGPVFFGVNLRPQREHARSLVAHDPWVVQNREFRANPIINQGNISSVTAGSRAGWHGVSSAVQVELSGEFAGKVAGGDFVFNRYIGSAEYAMQAVANHAIDIYFHAQGPLPGTDSLPLQRWSFVGGSPTLYTFPIGFFPGDRVVAVKTEYLIPGNRRLRLPFVGVPDFTLIHAAGMAWTRHERRRLEQNLGAQIQLFVVYARFVVNPSSAAGGSKSRFSVGVKLPGTRRPWEKLAEAGRHPRIRSRF
jgi:hypothetical protein